MITYKKSERNGPRPVDGETFPKNCHASLQNCAHVLKMQANFTPTESL